MPGLSEVILTTWASNHAPILKSRASTFSSIWRRKILKSYSSPSLSAPLSIYITLYSQPWPFSMVAVEVPPLLWWASYSWSQMTNKFFSEMKALKCKTLKTYSMKHYRAKPSVQAVHWAQYCMSNNISYCKLLSRIQGGNRASWLSVHTINCWHSTAVWHTSHMILLDIMQCTFL